MYQADLLKGKTAFIAGGTSGINLSIAKGLASYGASVTVLGRDVSKAQAAADEVAANGSGKSAAETADVRDPDQVLKALQSARENFGKIDILISGAAGNFPAPALGISPKGFKTVVDIDLLGTYNVFHCGFEHLNQGASLIAITAPQAVVPMPYQAHVCAAKAGINMLIKCLALEWGPAGLRVNGISPGPIEETEGYERLAPNEQAKQQMVKQIPSRRAGTGNDIADAAIYLGSSLSSYVNGTILTVDGGTELGDASADCLSIPARK